MACCAYVLWFLSWRFPTDCGWLSIEWKWFRSGIICVYAGIVHYESVVMEWKILPFSYTLSHVTESCFFFFACMHMVRDIAHLFDSYWWGILIHLSINISNYHQHLGCTICFEDTWCKCKLTPAVRRVKFNAYALYQDCSSCVDSQNWGDSELIAPRLKNYIRRSPV